jgi:DNA-binding transcriptional LysR family regulator
MEMHQIRYFLAAARLLNFTRAAEECNVTQPSLTRAIQKLEDEFGGLLFRRERSLTHLTELGRMMVPHLERTFEAAQAAKSLAKGMGKDVQAPIALGVAGSISTHLRSAFTDVANALPGFRLSLTKAESSLLIEGLMKGDLDAAVLIEPRDAPDRFDRILLVQQEYGIIVPRDSSLGRSDKASLADLSSIHWIKGESDVAQEFEERCTEAGVEIEFRHMTASEPDIVDLVVAGLGYALAPVGLNLPDTVTFVEMTDLKISRATVLATIAGRKRSAATDALIRAIKARAWTEN